MNPNINNSFKKVLSKSIKLSKSNLLKNKKEDNKIHRKAEM
jgi:hypothetical protein